MGDTYTRQSSYTDGDVITAAHTNNEFNQLLAAFASSSGHTHDGTAAEGGPITKLLGNSLTFGAGTAGTDITVTFDGETSDGVLKWMEDEDYFEFSDDILIASTEKLQFRDTAIYINSSTDGQLDIVADTEVQIAATTVDINGAVDISGNLTVGGSVIIGGNTLSSTELLFLDGITAGTVTASKALVVDSNKDIASLRNITITGELDAATLDISGDADIDGTLETDALSIDGTTITATATELNILDGVTATTAELNTLDGITAVVGELNALDLGSTAVGTAIASKAVILDSNKDYTGIRNLTISGDLTVSGDDITMGTNTSGNLLVADGTNFNSIAVGDLSEISTVANDDVFLAVDTSGGGLKKVTRSTIVSGLAVGGVALSNVVEDTTPQLGGNLDMNGQDIVTTSNANIELAPNGTGKVVVKGNTNQGAIQLNCEANSHGQIIIAAPHSESASNTLTLPSTGGNARLVSTSSTATLTNKTLTDPVITNITGSTITLDSAGDIVLDADGGDVFFKDGGTTFGSATNTSGNLIIKSGTTTAMTFDGANVALAGNLTVNGTTTTVNSTTTTVDDPVFTLGGDSAPGSDDNKDRGIEFRYHTGSAAKVGFFGFDDSAGKFTFIPDATNSSEVFSGTAGTIVANIEGNVTGNVTGNTSGTAATVTGAAQSNITSLGTLTTLTVDNVIVDGTTIGHTSDTDLITLASGVVTVAGEVSMTTLDIGGTNVTSTAAELNILDGVTSTAAELNILDGATATATELNIMDGDTSATSTTLADADRFVTNDAGTMKQVALTDVKTYLTSAGFSTDDPTALAIALG